MLKLYLRLVVPILDHNLKYKTNTINKKVHSESVNSKNRKHG